MAETPPDVAPDADAPRAGRPLFCLSNGDGATAPEALMLDLRAALADAFSCAPEAIRLNDPFRGGHITRAHGGGSLPWIQVEMNRSLYLAEPWFDRRTRTFDPARSEDLRTRFLAALHARFPAALHALFP